MVPSIKGWLKEWIEGYTYTLYRRALIDFPEKGSKFKPLALR